MLSPQQAFVIHLDSTTDLAAQRLVGRVEHVASGTSSHFYSLAELLAFLSRFPAQP